jgi:hypothetical protein
VNTSNAWAGAAARRIDTSICEVIASVYLFAGQNHRSIIPLQHRSKCFFCTENARQRWTLCTRKRMRRCQSLQCNALPPRLLDFALFAASVRVRLWLTRNKVAIISSLETCWLAAPFTTTVPITSLNTTYACESSSCSIAVGSKSGPRSSIKREARPIT